MQFSLIPPAYAAVDIDSIVGNAYANLDSASIVTNIVTTLSITIFSVAVAAFLLGALMYAAGFVNEENKSKGKSLMIGALIGMAVVLSAQTIFNTIYYFVYS